MSLAWCAGSLQHSQNLEYRKCWRNPANEWKNTGISQRHSHVYNYTQTYLSFIGRNPLYRIKECQDISHQSQFNENKMLPNVENHILTSKRANHFLREGKKSFLLPAMKTLWARLEKLSLCCTELLSSPVHNADLHKVEWKYSPWTLLSTNLGTPKLNFTASKEGKC